MQHEYELQFLLMVDCGPTMNLDFILSHELIGSTKLSARSISYAGNIIELFKNALADAILAKEAEDGYVYFPFRLEAVPVLSSITLQHQIDVAHRLESFLQDRGFKVAICADFEGLL